MSDEEIKQWLYDRLHVSRETCSLLERFIDLLRDANGRQNLIAPSTVGTVWHRHVLDSAQLLLHGGDAAQGLWIDIGTGAGFPGMVLAILDPARNFCFVESRKLRTAFLADAVNDLGLRNVTIMTAQVEAARLPAAATISARAVASLDRLFAAASHLADRDTSWILPKGRSAASELAEARETWQGEFTMTPSITDPEAAIIMARHVRRRTGG